MTVHLYLNGDVDKIESDPVADIKRQKAKLPVDDLPLEGGSTRFFAMNLKRYLDVVPATGQCLVFQHRGLLHSGEDVIQGTKYTMRADVLYEKID